ncbi:hypothetical protein [Luteolibacter sp. LG18]|uniref:hypothetical protein n=1 Tax=Luteolibacter sp. LG18 TaxID=2819286 RepID=UPI002B2B34D9|nr:hypothetical protein llg_10280 [Luteolibacter sp. LG18]
MRKLVWLLGIATVLGAAAWKFAPELQKLAPQATLPDPGPKPNAARYASLCQELAARRQSLATRWKKTRNAREKESIENEARTALESQLPAMMRCWLGTPWDFNGTATEPGGGKIACGYFVATLLRDAGFRVDRARLAQQASENIMRSFLDAKACHRTAGQPYDAFAAAVHAAEPGISIVGLDSHVGFLVNTADDFHMIHSSGSQPWCVVDEPSAEAGVLKRSNYRVTGHLTADRGVLRKWLSGDTIPVRVPGNT